MNLRVRTAGDGGFSLIEMIIAIAILGIGVIAIVSALGTSMRVGDFHRRFSDNELVLRDWAEALKRAAAEQPVASYQPCMNGTQADALSSSQFDKSTYLARGYEFPTPTVEYWHWTAINNPVTPDPLPGTFDTTCTPATDSGTVRVTLTVNRESAGERPSSRSAKIVIRKGNP